jgi:hypothetical protein
VDFVFTFVYNPINTVAVLAGLAPLNITSMGEIPVSVICVYFSAWSNALLGASKFVTGIAPAAQECTGVNCTSVFLPGGVELARLQGGNLNTTLLNGTLLKDAPTILIHDAPGYELDFYPMAENFSFDVEQDCGTYGRASGQGLHVCVSSINSAIIAGLFPTFLADC